MGAFHERELKDIIDNSYNYAKPLVINCPKGTYKVEIFGKTERKTYYDITDVFLDYEEGKAMGRILRFEE